MFNKLPDGGWAGRAGGLAGYNPLALHHLPRPASIDSAALLQTMFCHWLDRHLRLAS